MGRSWGVLGIATIGALLRRPSKKMRRAKPVLVERTITIGKPADELYRLLRAPETLSRVMGALAVITPQDDQRAHWSVRGPRNRTLEWDARIVEDRPPELFHWESAPESEIHGAVTVNFRPAPRDLGTEVSLQVRLDLDGRGLGVIGRHLGPIPGALASKALHRFKSLAETGEVPALTPQPAARRGGRELEGGRS